MVLILDCQTGSPGKCLMILRDQAADKNQGAQNVTKRGICITLCETNTPLAKKGTILSDANIAVVM